MIEAMGMGASCAECYRKGERIATLERQLSDLREKLDWTPISQDNLPKVGDEVGCFEEAGCVIYEVGQMHTFFTSDKWRNERAMTHRRPIHAPLADPQDSE